MIIPHDAVSTYFVSAEDETSRDGGQIVAADVRVVFDLGEARFAEVATVELFLLVVAPVSSAFFMRCQAPYASTICVATDDKAADGVAQNTNPLKVDHDEPPVLSILIYDTTFVNLEKVLFTSLVEVE